MHTMIAPATPGHPDWIEAREFAAEELALLPERKLLRFALAGRTQELNNALCNVYRHSVALGDVPGDAVDEALAGVDGTVLDDLRLCERAGLLRRFSIADPVPAQKHGCGCEREDDGPARERFARAQPGAGTGDRVMSPTEQYMAWRRRQSAALQRFLRRTRGDNGANLSRFGRQASATTQEFDRAKAQRAEAGQRYNQRLAVLVK